VFGLLRQRKLDFLDIYSDEMIAAAKAIVSQVTPQIRGQSAGYYGMGKKKKTSSSDSFVFFSV